MFDSGISASGLISALKDEIDVAIPIPNRSYVESLNSLEQLLYTEIIREQKEAVISLPDLFFTNEFDLSGIVVGEDEKPVVFEDVYTLYDSNGVQFKKSNAAMCRFIKNTWCKCDENTIAVNPGRGVLLSTIYIIYFVRPALKTVNSSDVVDSGNVMLPTEFIDLAKAKLRADAYKIANEDALSAKWTADYNQLLEMFKAWIENKRPHFGL